MSAGMMKIIKKRAQNDTMKNAMCLNNIMMRIAVTGRLWGRRLGFALGIFLGLLSPITEAAPTVFLTSPPAANTVQYLTPATFNVSANVTPSAGTTIAQVEFYQGTTLIGTTTISPHTIVQTSLPAGSYSFTAKATDSAGGVTTSAARNVAVNASNQPPTVSLVAPSNNAQYQAPANVTLLAGANGIELNTPITQVEFLDGTTVIATVTAMPYTVAWTNPPAGTHSLTARATDSDGAVTTSAARTITVMAAGAKLYYLHSDHLETPRLVTDEQNKVVWRNMPLTEPFGTSPPEEDPDGDGNLFTMNLRFPGQYADKETNTNYNYFRDYNPDTGRYVQSDPIGLLGGINTYGYVNGQPLRYVDPSGEILINPITIGAAIGGVAGAIQAANSGGGWTQQNAWNIVVGAATGAGAGALAGLLPGSAGWLAAARVGAISGAAGNATNQWLGGTSIQCTNWGQVGTQGLVGVLGGITGWGGGLSSALGVVRAGGSSQGAILFGNAFGAISGGSAQLYANLPIATNSGGFWPSAGQNQCGCNQ